MFSVFNFFLIKLNKLYIYRIINRKTELFINYLIFMGLKRFISIILYIKN